MSVVVERKYQMIRMKAGDYLLPSNDGQTLWRIYSYEEDGSSEVSSDGKHWRTLRGTWWMVSRHRTPLPQIAPHLIGEKNDIQDWENWEQWSGPLKTRDEAIQEALRHG